MATLGPVHFRIDADGGTRLGLWASALHLGRDHSIHGGVLATLADNAMGSHAARTTQRPGATVSLTLERAGPISPGRWLEVHSILDREHDTLLFSRSIGTVDGVLAFRAHAVFSTIRLAARSHMQASDFLHAPADSHVTDDFPTTSLPPVPAGFEVETEASAFLALLGPTHLRAEADGDLTIGLWVDAPHLNHQGAMHGGMVATLAEHAMGEHVGRILGGRFATVNMAVDYLARVPQHGWVEVRARIDRRGKKILFASCAAELNGALVFRAHGVFSVIAAA